MEQKNIKNILITGGNGLLGSTLKKVLKEKGYKVYAFEGDICDDEAVRAYTKKKIKFNWIIHTAAITNVDLCEKKRDLCYRVNAFGTENIRDLAEAIGAKLLYISTVSVFSGREGNYKETDLPYPNNFYNLTKFLGEQFTLEYNNGIVLRLNLIGVHLVDGDRRQNFFEWLVDSIKNNKSIKLFNDVLINPLSNWTIAEVVSELIKIRTKEKILHIGSKNILSKADIGRLAIERFKEYKGKVKLVSIDETVKDASRPKQMWLNTDYVQTKLGLEMPTLESEIEKILGRSNLL